MSNFFFTSTWTQAQAGLYGLNGVLQGIAFSLLTVTFLMGVYESFARNGSLHGFGTTVVKFAVAGAIIANWPAFMTDVVSTGTSIANAFLAGNGDLISQWVTQAESSLQNSPGMSIMNGASGLAWSIVALLILTLSFVIFLSCLKLLTIFFVFWGGILYCLGPMLIALAPSGFTGSYTAQYARSLAEWALWPALYAIFVTMMNAIGMANVSAVLTSTPGPQEMQANMDAILTTMVSLLYGLCVVFIPFIAHAVIGGSFTGVVMGIVGTAKAAMSMASGGLPIGGGGGGGGGSSIIITKQDDDQGGGGGGSAASNRRGAWGVPPPDTTKR